MNRLLDRARRSGPEAGITLAELIVTMMVFSFLSLLVVSLMSSFSQNFTRDRSATDSSRIASVAMNELTRVIRAGTTIQTDDPLDNDLPVFLIAAPESLVIRAFLDTDSASPQPLVARFEITAARTLVEKRWKAVAGSGPNWTFTGVPSAPYPLPAASWTGATYTRTIAQTITPLAAALAAPGGASTFVYLDDQNNPIPMPATGKLDDLQLRRIAAVRIQLSVQADLTGRAQPVVLQNSVALPNLGITRVGS